MRRFQRTLKQNVPGGYMREVEQLAKSLKLLGLELIRQESIQPE